MHTTRNGLGSSHCAYPKENAFLHALYTVLEHLLSLALSGLVVSLVGTHLAAFTAFHEEVQGSTIFANKVTQRFLRGLSNVPFLAPILFTMVPIPSAGHSYEAPSSLWTLLTGAPFKNSNFLSCSHICQEGS